MTNVLVKVPSGELLPNGPLFIVHDVEGRYDTHLTISV